MAPYSNSVRNASDVTSSESSKKPSARAIPPRHPKRTYPLGMTRSIPNPIPNPYPCPHCGKCFQSPQALNIHQNNHRQVPMPISDAEAARLLPIRVPGRQTYENRLNYLMNPNPGNGNVGPYEPTDVEKFNLWRNAPSYYFYKYHFNNEIDNNISRDFKNSYQRNNNIRPAGFSLTAKSSNNAGNKRMDNEGNEVSSNPVTRSRDGRRG